MVKKNQITVTNIFKKKQNEIIQRWINNIQESNQFIQDKSGNAKNLISDTKDFYNKILNTIEQEAIPEYPTHTFQPIIKFWHNILHEQSQKGFTTKDTALLIFSLKTSIMEYIKEYYGKQEFKYTPELNKLNNLLDFLGVLTFEVYTAEKEKLIDRQQEQIHYLQEINAKQKFEKFIGVSPRISGLYKTIGLILENDINVLLQGETGTGKDLIATIIHQNSNRKGRPFITINCGAIPKDLLESELFGYEKGAFTGAEIKKTGKFELAHKGTLFLDEISEMPLHMQVKLLRAIQNQEIERIGSTERISIDVRIIAATNKDLKKAVDKGTFRADLYYRLNVFPIIIPLLKERKEDILPLAYYFLDMYSKRYRTKSHALSEDAKEYLLNHNWPGNVRELENLMQRATILAQGKIITSAILRTTPGEDISHVLFEEASSPKFLSETVRVEPLEESEKKIIEQALKIKKGNLAQVAKALKISRTTLYNKLKKYKLLA